MNARAAAVSLAASLLLLTACGSSPHVAAPVNTFYPPPPTPVTTDVPSSVCPTWQPPYMLASCRAACAWQTGQRPVQGSIVVTVGRRKLDCL